jgi:hypothetical protein
MGIEGPKKTEEELKKEEDKQDILRDKKRDDDTRDFFGAMFKSFDKKDDSTE